VSFIFVLFSELRFFQHKDDDFLSTAKGATEAFIGVIATYTSICLTDDGSVASSLFTGEVTVS
jgi:hypothetical protein